VIVCYLLVVESRHFDFQLIFNYRPEHVILVKTFIYQSIIPITDSLMSYLM